MEGGECKACSYGANWRVGYGEEEWVWPVAHSCSPVRSTLNCGEARGLPHRLSHLISILCTQDKPVPNGLEPQAVALRTSWGTGLGIPGPNQPGQLSIQKELPGPSEPDHPSNHPTVHPSTPLTQRITSVVICGVRFPTSRLVTSFKAPPSSPFSLALAQFLSP